MPGNGDAGSGTTKINPRAKRVYIKVKSTINKQSYTNWDFSSGLPIPAPVFPYQLAQESEPSNSATSSIASFAESSVASSTVNSIIKLKRELRELIRNYTLPEAVWKTEKLALSLEEQYVKPSLQDESGQLTEIEAIINQVDPEKLSTILIKGQPGYGKTTMAIKLALDWADEIDYMLKFELVFLLPLRQLCGLTTIKNTIAYIGKRLGFNREEIKKIISENKQSTLFIFDGLDELPVESQHHIHEILDKRRYKKVTVIVFSRFNPVITNEHTEVSQVISFDKKLTILGIKNCETKIQFLNKIMPAARVNDIKPLLQLDLFDSPLFLMFLQIIMHVDQNIAQFTNKTEFFKQIFHCIIKHSCQIQNYPCDKLMCFDLFHHNLSDHHNLLFDQIKDNVHQFGKLCLTKIINSDLQFESDDNLIKDIFNIGLLSKHTLPSKFDLKNHYEAFHLSIMEFAAAFTLWMEFIKTHFESITKEQFCAIACHFFNTNGTCLVLPFLASLMDNNLDVLLLQIHEWFPLQSLIYTVKLLTDCSFMNIQKSKYLKMLILPDLNLSHKKFDDNDTCKEILANVIASGQIKNICIDLHTSLEILPSDAVKNSSLLLRLNDCLIILISTVPCISEEIVSFSNLPSSEQLKKSLDYIISVDAKCFLRLIKESDLAIEFVKMIAETESYNQIKYQYLEVCVISKLDENVIKKLINNNQVQFLSMSGNRSEFSSGDNVNLNLNNFNFSNAIYLTSIKLSYVTVNLYNLTCGGTKKYNHIILNGCVVTCTHLLSKKNCCDYLKIRYSKGIKAIAELEPTKLAICDYDVIKLKKKCSEWTGFDTVKHLTLTVTGTEFSIPFPFSKNLETLHIRLKQDCTDEMIVECIQKSLKITKLIIKNCNFYFLEQLKCKDTPLKSIDLIFSSEGLDSTKIIDASMKGLEHLHWDKVKLIFNKLDYANEIVQKYLTKFSVSYCCYGSDVDDPEVYKIKCKYNLGLVSYYERLVKWIVITVIRK